MHQIESGMVDVNTSRLKRKRHLHTAYGRVCESISDGEEEAIVESLNDCSSNSSTSSTCSSTGSSSYTFKLNKVQHGHKLLITEETMSDALKDLCMDSEMCSNENAKSLIPFESINDNHQDEADDEEEEECNPCIIQLSDELKSKLKEYFFANATNLPQNHQNNMQLVVWSPRVNVPTVADCEADLSSSSDSLKTDKSDPASPNDTAYKIEEPQSKNKLKRKYSQLNKISIEELVTSKHDRVEKPSFYLVDQFDNGTDNDSHQNLIYLNQSKSSSNVKITEIVNSQDATAVSYEPMDV